MLAPRAPEDIRVETAGQWTRGMHIIDRRNRKKAGVSEQVKSPGAVDISNPFEDLAIANADDAGDDTGDNGSWLNPAKGNRVNRNNLLSWRGCLWTISAGTGFWLETRQSLFQSMVA